MEKPLGFSNMGDSPPSYRLFLLGSRWLLTESEESEEVSLLVQVRGKERAANKGGVQNFPEASPLFKKNKTKQNKKQKKTLNLCRG